MKLKLFSLIVICFFFSCAPLKEADIVRPDIIISNPAVSTLRDSLLVRQVKSAIQSNPTTLLANNMKLKDGKWCLALSVESADSLGVPRSTYNQYILLVEELNAKMK